MGIKIIWDKKSLDFLRKLDRNASKRIVKKIGKFSDNPKRYLFSLVNVNAKKLKVGDYRLF